MRRKPAHDRAPVAAVAAALVAGTALAALTSCRAPRRGVRVGSDAATVKVTMVGLDKADESRTDWVYELSGCVSALNGQHEGGNVVAFTSVGLRKDLTCQLRVKTVGDLPTGIQFASDSEPGTFYWARDFRIEQAPTGGLEAKAGMQKLYKIEPTADAAKAFTLKVPVKFKQPEATTPVTADIECAPAIARTAFYPSDNPLEGELVFSVAIDRDTPFECSQVRVHAGGVKDRYVGVIPDDSRKFVGVPQQTVTLKQVELKGSGDQQPPPPPGDQGVAVEVTPSDCPDGTVFDTVKKDCVAPQ